MDEPVGSSFAYVIYIRTTPEALWSALREPAFTKQYWFGISHESDWQPGSPWRMTFSDGRVADTGQIVEADPPRRLVLDWRNELRPELHEEGVSRCTIELEPVGEAVKLSIHHTMGRPGTAFIKAVSGGWPQVLSNLKSLLETGAIAYQR